jgi:Pectic acid lyase
MTAAAAVVERTRYYVSLLNADVARGYLRLPRTIAARPADSLGAAIDWICRAQDAFGDGGVARSYSLAYHPYFKRAGWIPSYPETTGYIIPTLFDYAKQTAREDLLDRAVRMADWECDVQMPNGAVQGGTIDEPATPAVFNTGQVIFGWVRAYQETRREQYLAAAVRAGDFLVDAQDGDGAWRKSLSDFASRVMKSYTYNTRTAWALQVLAEATGDPVYRDAAIRNVEFALTEQLPNGWFKNNCLYDPARPLLHTIGIALGNTTYIAAARRAADALLETQDENGRLGGRFDDGWRPAVAWSCLTGNAQMGTVWARLHHATGDQKYFDALVKANRFLRRVQWRDTGNPGLDGGISGSDPIHGRYGRFEVLNWAVKFFADSLMFEAAGPKNARASA